MDLAHIDLEWLIELAEAGDGKLLAARLRDRRALDSYLDNEKTRAILVEFIARVISGEIRLPRPAKRTYLAWRRANIREAAVVSSVHVEMGKSRNPARRTQLTREYCEIYGTTLNAVADFLKRGKKLRRGPYLPPRAKRAP